VTSPLDHSVTSGNLCIKGRFGFQFVQNDRSGLPPPLEDAGLDGPGD
jgi:predicted molibdopterin-dependent oxidoreductase YjgC